MESSSALITWVSAILLASSVFPVSEAYTVSSTNPCTKEFIRKMVIEMCSRHKRSSENGTKADPLPSLSPLSAPIAKQKNPTIPSSLDTLFFGLFGHSHEVKELFGDQELQRIERAENKLRQCCMQGMCSQNDFANAC